MSDKLPVFIFINGILNKPGSAKGWTDRAVTWIETHTDCPAEKFEYATGVFRLRQSRHIQDFADLLGSYSNREVIIAAHSNGASIVTEALKRLPIYRIKSLHLISPASMADFNKTGFNDDLASGRIQKIKVYIGEKDWAMVLAKWTGFLFGFGTLGKTGPVNNDFPSKVEIEKIPDFGHSTWFDDRFFGGIMAGIAGSYTTN